jgi:hypothetical protein
VGLGCDPAVGPEPDHPLPVRGIMVKEGDMSKAKSRGYDPTLSRQAGKNARLVPMAKKS